MTTNQLIVAALDFSQFSNFYRQNDHLKSVQKIRLINTAKRKKNVSCSPRILWIFCQVCSQASPTKSSETNSYNKTDKSTELKLNWIGQQKRSQLYHTSQHVFTWFSLQINWCNKQHEEIIISLNLLGETVTTSQVITSKTSYKILIEMLT